MNYIEITLNLDSFLSLYTLMIIAALWLDSGYHVYNKLFREFKLAVKKKKLKNEGGGGRKGDKGRYM